MASGFRDGFFFTRPADRGRTRLRESSFFMACSSRFAVSGYPIGISAPLIWMASSDARKIKVWAMDSGRTHFDGSAAGMAFLLAGVSIVLGRTPFTVTPEPFSSVERARIKATRPAFETTYAAAPGN